MRFSLGIHGTNLEKNKKISEENTADALEAMFLSYILFFAPFIQSSALYMTQILKE